MHIVSIVGTRPEAIKMAPLVLALQKEPWIKSTLVLTGQHRQLLDQALLPFGVRGDHDLDLMRANQSLGELTGRAFIALEGSLRSLRPDFVLAQGDTTTVMAAAVSSFYLNIPFGHVEAGLRTGDLRYPFPEEFNRIVAGVVAERHFTPTHQAAAALLSQKIDPSKIVVTGNTVIDALNIVRDRLPSPPVELPQGKRLILMTAHRRENFGAPLHGVFSLLRELLDEREDLHLLYPVHPNPNVQQAARDAFANCKQASLVEPLGYLEFVAAMKAAYLILTDSGGVQEEAPALSKPVLVLREETERPEAVSAGVARLVGTQPANVRAAIELLLDDQNVYRVMASGASPYGDGLACERIVRSLAKFAGVDRKSEVEDFH